MATYNEETIQTLDPLTHIRLRSGMYIGRLGDGTHPDDGIYVLLKEVIDNSIDEYIMGHGSSVDIAIDFASGDVVVRDYGRGIPLGKIVECVSHINTGAKYNDEVFQFSVGLNGVGLKAVNALSENFLVRAVRDGKFAEARFAQGKLQEQNEGKTNEPNGTRVSFRPDPEIFPSFAFAGDFVKRRLDYYAYLNNGLALEYNGTTIKSEGGLLDLLSSEVAEETPYPPMHFRSKTLEFAFVHGPHYGEMYYAFVNGQYTADGGTHLAAFREGVVKAISEYAKKSFQGIDVREGLLGVLLVRVKDPVFESQTKNKLSNPELKAPITQEVKEAVLDLLYKNPQTADTIIQRTLANEKLRKELAQVRLQAKESQKKSTFKIPKLRDCRYHLHDDIPQGEQTMIFLTEGDSACASIVSSRDPLTQAVFPLRGKPMNVYGMKQAELYRNEELYHVARALNIENGMEGLRYNKVILATDADVDGMHIRNLLITFFLTYFESLVLGGHCYILETPLFKVRTKDNTTYCFTEKERDAALQKSSRKSAEVTRFKGLGEISPSEFKPFIGSKMRLVPLTLGSLADVAPMLEFYMGKNTPQRKEFIMNNLIVDALA